jgi:3-hydroxyacyl-CoA dehydrogenase
MGPLQLADFIGLDVCLAILKGVYMTAFGNAEICALPFIGEHGCSRAIWACKIRQWFLSIYVPGSKEHKVACQVQTIKIF